MTIIFNQRDHLSQRQSKLTHSILHEILDLSIFPRYIYEVRADVVLLFGVWNTVIDVHQIGHVQNTAHMAWYVGFWCIFACQVSS